MYSVSDMDHIFLPDLDPTIGEIMADAAESDAWDIDRAVYAKHKAFDEISWPRMTTYVRLNSTHISLYLCEY